MANQPRALGDEILSLFVTAMRPFVEERLEEHYGPDWKKEVGLESRAGFTSLIRHLGDPEELLKRLLDPRDWDHVFSPSAGEQAQEVRIALENLSKARNRLYHHRPFRLSDVVSLAEDALLVASVFGAGGVADLEALTGIQQEAAAAVAGTTRPDLAELRHEYLESVISDTTYLRLGGISPSVASRVVRVRLAEVFVPPSFTAQRPQQDEGWHTGSAIDGLAFDNAVSRANRSRYSRYLFHQAQRTAPENGEEFDTTSLLDEEHVVVLGGAGAGKSTLLRYLARTMAVPPETGARARMPIRVALRDYGEVLAADPRVSFRRYVTSIASDRFGEVFQAEIETGNACLLLDGLDEITDDALRNKVSRSVAAFCAQYPLVQAIVTSRPTGFGATELGDRFRVLWLRPLSVDQIEAFVLGWSRVLGLDEPSDESEDPHLLVAQIVDTPTLRALAATPLVLTILTLLWARDTRLPERRIEVLNVASETLLRDWPLHRLGQGVDTVLVYAVLEPVAHHMLANGLNEIGEQAFLAIAADAIRTANGGEVASAAQAARALARVIEADTGVLVDVGVVNGGRAFAFVHRIFAEYMAARYVAEQWTAGDLAIRDYLYDDSWREVLRLTFAHVSSMSVALASRLLRELLDSPDPLDSRVHGTLRIALSVLADGLRVVPALRDQVLAHAVDTCIDVRSEIFRPFLMEAVAMAAKAQRVSPQPTRGHESARGLAVESLLRLMIEPDDGSALRTCLEHLDALVAQSAAPEYDFDMLLGVLGPQLKEDAGALLMPGGAIYLDASTLERLISAGCPRFDPRDTQTDARPPVCVVEARPDASAEELAAMHPDVRAAVMASGHAEGTEAWLASNAAWFTHLYDDPTAMTMDDLIFIDELLSTNSWLEDGFGARGTEVPPLWLSLVRATRRADDPVRAEAVLALAEADGEFDLPRDVLAEIVPDNATGMGVRTQQAFALAAAGQDPPTLEMRELLRELCGSSDPLVAAAARRAMVACGAAEGFVPAWLQGEAIHPSLCETGRRDLTRRIAWRLREADTTDLSDVESAAIESTLIALASTGEVPDERDLLLRDLLRTEEGGVKPATMRAAIRLSRAATARERLWAAHLHGAYAPAASADILLRLLDDADPEVRMRSAWGLTASADFRTVLEQALPIAVAKGPPEAAEQIAYRLRMESPDRASRRDLAVHAELELEQHPDSVSALAVACVLSL